MSAKYCVCSSIYIITDLESSRYLGCSDDFHQHIRVRCSLGYIKYVGFNFVIRKNEKKTKQINNDWKKNIGEKKHQNQKKLVQFCFVSMKKSGKCGLAIAPPQLPWPIPGALARLWGPTGVGWSWKIWNPRKFGYMEMLLKIWILAIFSRMRSKGSRFILGVWGLSCVRQMLRNRPQPFATVRVRTIWPCLW